MSQFPQTSALFSWKKVGMHAFGWLMIYLVYTAMLSPQVSFQHFAITNVVTVSIYMLAYYFLRYVQLPKLYRRKRYALFILSLIFSTLFLCLLYALAWKFWLQEATGYTASISWFDWNNYALKSVRFYSPAMALILLESFVGRKSKRSRIQELENEKIKNELKFLKASVNPQFISASLNHLHSQVLSQSPHAPEMIMSLSNILDYALYRSQKSTVPLKEELDAIQHFIDLEQIRFGDKNKIVFRRKAQADIMVSPLIYFTAVEQVVRQIHPADYEHIELEILVQREGQELRLSVKSTSFERASITPANTTMLDISSLQRRLNLLYPDRHAVKLEKTIDGYHFSMEIDHTS